MAESAMTTTGLAELKAANESFPAELTRALIGVAVATGIRVRDRAKSLVPKDRPKTVDHITMRADGVNKQVLVESASAPGDVTNLVLMLEYGSARNVAAFYMRRAAAAETERYRSDMAAAVEATVRRVFKD